MFIIKKIERIFLRYIFSKMSDDDPIPEFGSFHISKSSEATPSNEVAPVVNESTNIISMIENKFKDMTKEDILIFIVSDIIPFIHREAKKCGIEKIFDNYNFRQQQMLPIMKMVLPNVILSKNRTGKDASSLESPILENIEMKSIGIEKLINIMKQSFPFDKQNDPQRRKETLEYNAFVFSIVYEEKTRLVLIAVKSETIVYLNKLLKDLQTKFMKHWEENIAAGKRGGHDAVRLSIKDMLEGDNIWHLWINGLLYKDINSENCISEIKNFQNSVEKPLKKEKTEDQKKAIAAKAKATREANKIKKANAPQPSTDSPN